MAASETQETGETKREGVWLVRGTIGLLFVDALVSHLLLLPIRKHERSTSDHYTVAESLYDLVVLSICRVFTALIAFGVAYGRGKIRDEYPFDVYHKNGKKKTRDELEEEALSQSFGTWLKRYVNRASFPAELACLFTTLLAIVKCLVRLNKEIGVLRDAEPVHPLVWLSFSFAAVVSVIEVLHMDAVCLCLGKWGSQQEPSPILRRISSHLSVPLLADNDEEEGQEEEASEEASDAPQPNDEHATGDNGIGGDTDYKAKFSDLLQLCAPDVVLIAVAFVFLVLAAMMQIYIPKYTGACLDALEEAYSGNDDDDNGSIQDIPGFMNNVKKLIVVSALSGLFSGIRGSIFTMVGGRVNVRLRMRLMDSLLTMEQGFFDLTKTGDITSRLSSDTTLVGDQVTLNVNVFLRSLVQVIGVLIFMFMLSWQLSLLAFISVPVITILSRWYGNFVRSLTKVMQTKLAEGNSVSEAAISSMPTVRAFDAAPTEYKEFKGYMDQYLDLTFKNAVAYSGYATVSTSLPQLVTALGKQCINQY